MRKHISTSTWLAKQNVILSLISDSQTKKNSKSLSPAKFGLEIPSTIGRNSRIEHRMCQRSSVEADDKARQIKQLQTENIKLSAKLEAYKEILIMNSADSKDCEGW